MSLLMGCHSTILLSFGLYLLPLQDSSNSCPLNGYWRPGFYSLAWLGWNICPLSDIVLMCWSILASWLFLFFISFVVLGLFLNLHDASNWAGQPSKFEREKYVGFLHLIPWAMIGVERIRKFTLKGLQVLEHF